MKIKCLKDVHYGTSLKKGKIYEGRPCGKGWFAMVDETGEEYAYPPELFEIIESENVAPVKKDINVLPQKTIMTR